LFWLALAAAKAAALRSSSILFLRSSSSAFLRAISISRRMASPMALSSLFVTFLLFSMSAASSF
jgi:hypothetical protein